MPLFFKHDKTSSFKINGLSSSFLFKLFRGENNASHFPPVNSVILSEMWFVTKTTKCY